MTLLEWFKIGRACGAKLVTKGELINFAKVVQNRACLRRKLNHRRMDIRPNLHHMTDFHPSHHPVVEFLSKAPQSAARLRAKS